MTFRNVGFILGVLLLPASAEGQQPLADSTLSNSLAVVAPNTIHMASARRSVLVFPDPPVMLPAVFRAASDSTTGIPVIMGGALGGITFGALARFAGVYEDGTEDPWTAALAYGAGVGAGAAMGAILGDREPKFLPTTAVALSASIPLALILIEQRGLEPSSFDGLAILVGLVPPIIGAWLTNKVLQ